MNILILAASVLLAWVPTILATSVLLAWDANPEPDFAGYKIHVGIQSLTAGNPPSQVLDVGNVTQSEVQGLDFATQYFFVATAYNNAGLASGYSNEVTFTPMPPVEDKIRYWPRVNCNGRMNGGRFEAAQSRDGPWITLGWSRWWPSYSGEQIILPPGTLSQYKRRSFMGNRSRDRVHSKRGEDNGCCLRNPRILGQLWRYGRKSLRR